MKLKVLELFGGIGACTKALKNIGVDYEVVDYVEIDKFAVKSYNAINETSFVPQNILDWNKHLNIDLIMHGSPCQDFSVNGKQRGGDIGSGTRSSLMYETLRIVGDLKPKYVIWENVKNLLSKKHRHNFDNYLTYMSTLGYQNYYKVLNAKYFGIPQNRERVFTVSIRNDINVEFEFPKEQSLTLRMGDFEDKHADECYYFSDDRLITIANWGTFIQPLSKVCGKNSIMPTVTAGESHGSSGGMILYCSQLNDTSNVVDYCLRIKDHSLDANKLRIRRITPKESWKLMGFSDDDYNKASSVNSRTQLYKQAGNSIVVNVLMAIFTKLFVTNE